MNASARSTLKLLLAGALIGTCTAAAAAPITGAISSAGTICLGSTPSTPVGSTCTHQDASTLTYIDFINGSLAPVGLTASPGLPGNFIFLTAFEDLMPLLGQIGQFFDVTLPGPSDPLSSFVPVSPLWQVTGTDGMTYTYTLDHLDSIFRLNGHALDVRGTGDLCRNGIDCTIFNFIFTTQDTDLAIRTTFSLSQSGLTVPEPGPLGLLGVGLFGLAVVARRRLGL